MADQGTAYRIGVDEGGQGQAGRCGHLTELLMPLATVAYQTIMPIKRARRAAVEKAGRSTMIDSCYAYASNREVVMKRWPEFYSGARGKAS